MNYLDFVKHEMERIKAAPILELLKSLKGKKVLIYGHDDPDGITSALIFIRLLKKLQIGHTLIIPPTIELEEERLKKGLKDDNFDAVFVLDKATMGYYDKYYDCIKNFAVIDHHPLQGERPEKILVMNPQIHGDYKSCSTSFIVHMLMTCMTETDKYDDFLALVGLKGDWAIDPATDTVSEYAGDFYNERITGTFDDLIKKIQSRPTMFEFMQREKTTLLNQITELYFALCGGGFQYFYNDRQERLKNINQPEFSYAIMEKQSENFKFNSWKNLEDFIDNTCDPEIVNIIFELFKDDWKKTIRGFSNSTLLSTLTGTDVYMFLGYRVPLMPMAGSVHINELKKDSAGKEVLFIMVNREASGNIHFSLRGTSAGLHSGKICSNLTARLVSKYNHKDQITGGGHPFAAECRTRESGVKLSQALEVFAKLIMDIEEADKSVDREEGLKLGLEYLDK